LIHCFEQAEKAAAMKDKQLNDLLGRMMQYERVRGYLLKSRAFTNFIE